MVWLSIINSTCVKKVQKPILRYMNIFDHIFYEYLNSFAPRWRWRCWPRSGGPGAVAASPEHPLAHTWRSQGSERRLAHTWRSRCSRTPSSGWRRPATLPAIAVLEDRCCYLQGMAKRAVAVGRAVVDLTRSTAGIPPPSAEA
jgi:hypothetical protein